MGVSVSKSMSGLCRSIIVPVSVKEGLFCPAFHVFSVRMVNSMLGSDISAGGVVVSAPSGVWVGRHSSGDGGLVCCSGPMSSAVCAEVVAGDAVRLSCGTVVGGGPRPSELGGE